MKGNYAAYQRLTPAVADTQQLAQKAADIYKGIKTKEDAKVATTQKKYEEYLKDLVDYTDTFNEADVDYYFKDEMMRVGSDIRDELYDIHMKRTQMEHYGDPNSKEYRSLIAKDQQLRGAPSVFKSVFDQYQKSLAEYESGKGTKYDTQLNAELESKMVKAMNGGWKFNLNKSTFDVVDPDTGEKTSLSPGQFSSTPLMFGRPKLMVDIPNITKAMAAEIGVESRSYYDPTSNSQVTIKKSEASGRQKELIRGHIIEQIDAHENLGEKLRLNGMNKYDYADTIMTAAGFRSGTYRSSVPKTSGAGGSSSDYWKQFPPETVDSIGVAHYGDGSEFEIKNPALNAVSFRGTGKVSVNPSSVFIMNTSSPLYVSRAGTEKVKGVTAEGEKEIIPERDSEIIEGRTVSKVSSGIQDFAFQRAQQMNIYQGDEQYRVRFSNEEGKPASMILRKGKEVPQGIFDGDFELEIVGQDDESKIISPSLRGNTVDDIKASSKLTNMAIGEGKIGGSELLLAIPMDQANEAAVSSINSTTRTGAFKNTKGFLSEWQTKYGSSNIDSPITSIEDVHSEDEAIEAEVFSPTELAGKTSEELMALDSELSKEDADMLADKTEEELLELLQ